MKKSAFSLLELSVSLVVVSLLMAMVSQGIKIIASSSLTTARSLTSKSPVPNISGLIAWYETSSVDSFKTNEAFDGKQISAWYDISPNSIPAKKNTLMRTTSAAITYEAEGINKLPSIYFNTVSGTPTLSLSSFYQGRSAQTTVFVVSQPTTVSGLTGVLFDSSSQDSNMTLGALFSTYAQICGGNCVNISQTITANSPYISAFYLNSTNSKIYLNNASTIIGGAVVNAGTNSMNGFCVGMDRGGNWGIRGLISEVIVFNRPLMDRERKDVMGYLSKKYGILVTGL